MKKIVIAVILLFHINVIIGQSSDIIKYNIISNNIKIPSVQPTTSRIMHGENGIHYQIEFISDGFKSKGSLFKIIDENKKIVTERYIENPNTFNLLESFDNGNEIISIYHSITRDNSIIGKEKDMQLQEGFYINRISKSDSIQVWDPKLIYSFSHCEKMPCVTNYTNNHIHLNQHSYGILYFKNKYPQYYYDFCQKAFQISISPDKSKFSICFGNYPSNCAFWNNTSPNLEDIQILVFDKTGKKLWEKVENVSLISDRLMNFIIDDNANIYFASINHGKGVTDYLIEAQMSYTFYNYSKSISIYKVSESESIHFDKQIKDNESCFIGQGILQFTSTGNLFLAGHYSTKQLEPESGVYCLSFNTVTNSFSDLKRKYIENYEPAKKYYESDIATSDVYHFTDDRFAVVGHSWKKNRNSDVLENELFIDFIDNDFSFDGEYRAKLDDKFSYTKLFNNDKIYLYEWNKLKKKSNVFFKVLDNKGRVLKSNFINNEIKTFFPLFINNNGLLFMSDDCYYQYKNNN